MTISKSNKYAVHYFFSDESHGFDAIVRNECEKELLQIYHEVAKSLDLKLLIQSEPPKEDGFIEFWKFLGSNSNQITFKGRQHVLKAVIVYHSNQIMRIRVFGNKTSLLLENNYPVLLSANSKKGIQWKIREGDVSPSNAETDRLLAAIFQCLERHMKNDFLN